jgi:hypothetical protein
MTSYDAALDRQRAEQRTRSDRDHVRLVSRGARRIVIGVNFSVALGNPFRSFGQTGQGLEHLLAQQRAGGDEPIIFFLHLASPRVEFADRGKTALVISEGRTRPISEALS